MSELILYSTNPWYATEISRLYRNGIYFAWVSADFDAGTSVVGSSAALTGVSSIPKEIYRRLYDDCKSEDGHSALIRGYKKTFRRLTKDWFAEHEITEEQRDEIIANLNSNSWRIWRPVLYLIPRNGIHPSRIQTIKRPDRAAYGPEYKIVDLQVHEFDIIELWTL
jgi:hypothetical protein